MESFTTFNQQSVGLWHWYSIKHKVERYGNSPKLSIFASKTHDNGDVSKEHEIQLGFWHHGRVPRHSDIQKNQSRKDFPAIKFLFYKIVPISLDFPPNCSSRIAILPFFS